MQKAEGGRSSLEPEVVRSQPGVVYLQDDPGVVDGGRQDLQETGSWGQEGLFFFPAALPACGPH